MRTGFKKRTALLAAGMLAVATVFPMTASAAYVDMERENWTSFADAYGAMWDQAVAESQEGDASSGELKLEFGDMVRAMAGRIFTTQDGEPMDFSWLDSIAIRAAADRQEGGVVDVALGLCLNDVVLARLELPIDFGSDAVRLRVPELSESYLGAPFEFDTGEAKQQWQRLKDVLNPEYLQELAPDGAELAELLKRYGDMLLDGITDVDSEEKTERIESVEENFTVEEGRLYADDLTPVVLGMAKQARDDAQLKEMIEDLGDFSSQTDLYEEYQKAMDNAIRDMEEDMPEPGRYGEQNYFSSKVWLDAEGSCAGREFALVSGGEKTMQFGWLGTEQGDQAAFRLYCTTEGQSVDTDFALSGVGTVSDGRLNGTYMVTQDGQLQYEVEVSDYDVNAAPGDLDGTYKFTYAAEQTDGSQGQSPLGGIALTADVERRAQEKVDRLSLSLTMDDEMLAALHLTEGEGADLLSADSAGDGALYDANDQEDLQKYVSEINPETILENCRKAGVPDKFLAQITGLVTGMMQSAQDSAETAQTSQGSAGTTQPQESDDALADEPETEEF